MNANDQSRYVGQNVDTVDQLSSVTLLGIAVLGALVTVVANLLVFG